MHRCQKGPSLAPQFMRLHARNKLWFRNTRNSSKHKNPEETEDVTASGSSKIVANSGVSMESVRMESKPCSKSATSLSRKNNPHILDAGESGLVVTPYL